MEAVQKDWILLKDIMLAEGRTLEGGRAPAEGSMLAKDWVLGAVKVLAEGKAFELGVCENLVSLR